MIIASDASEVEATIPNAGTPWLFSALKRAGNNPSRAAAIGTSAVISVQPFSAPKPEITTTAAITSPQKVPPNIALTALENGALASASVLDGRIPNTATSASTYTTAVASVPRSVARGTLRLGLRTFTAATDAVSTPR